MQTYSISTYDYEVDIEKLLKKRLLRQEFMPKLERTGDLKRVTVHIEDKNGLKRLCSALSELMLIDLKHLEIGRIVNSLPFSLEEKRRLLPRVLSSSASRQDTSDAASGLFDYLSESNLLILEGYMRFRMQDVIENWVICVDTAAEEQLLHEEYIELMRLLGMYTELGSVSCDTVTVLLQPDGSCTITDENDVRIDCAHGNESGVLNMLIGMSPQKIIVYDLSQGRCQALKESIKTLFGERVSCYS